MPSTPRRVLLGAALLAPVLAVGACSTGPTDGAASSSTSSGGGTDPDAYPVTIEHALGTTTVEQAPTRIATVGWSDQDVVAAFGIVPVGAPAITWGGNDERSTDWFDAAVADLDPDAEVVRYDDADGIPVDEIAELAPDLILGVNSGMSKEEYTKLTKIAPTVAYPDAPWGTAWEDSVTIIGEALGQADRAAEIVEDVDAQIDEAIARYPEIKGKSAAWLYFTPTDLSTFTVYADTDLRPQMLERLGMTTPDFVTKGSADGAFSFEVSAEQASTAESDIAIFYVEQAEEVEQLVEDDLIGTIPALASGHYVASADNSVALSMSSPSPLSIPTALEDFLPKIASAAKGEPAS